MSSAAMRGLRSRWVGWMRPSVRKVGAVQVATGALAVGALFTGVSWPWWVLALLGYFFYACVGHSVGYHRYFAHRSFRAPRWAEVMFTVAGTLGCVGSPVGWAQMHRRHHRLLGPGRRPLYRAPVSAPEPAGAADERVRLGAGECPRPSPDVPVRPAPGVRDAVLLRHRGGVRRGAARSWTGACSCTAGRYRLPGRFGWQVSMRGRRTVTVTVITTRRTGAGTCGGARSSRGERAGTTTTTRTPGRGAIGSDGGSGTSGAAVVWAILRQSNQRIRAHGAGPMDPVPGSGRYRCQGSSNGSRQYTQRESGEGDAPCDWQAISRCGSSSTTQERPMILETIRWSMLIVTGLSAFSISVSALADSCGRLCEARVGTLGDGR